MKNATVTMKQLVLGATLAIAMIGASASDALAETRTVPGNICQGSRGTGVPSGLNFYASLGVEYAYCAMPRHDSATTLGTSYVRVYNPSTSTTTSCYMYSCDSTGSTCDFESDSTSVAGNVSLYYNGANLTTYSTGYFYTYCYLPTYASIHGIRYSET